MTYTDYAAILPVEIERTPKSRHAPKSQLYRGSIGGGNNAISFYSNHSCFAPQNRRVVRSTHVGGSR